MRTVTRRVARALVATLLALTATVLAPTAAAAVVQLDQHNDDGPLPNSYSSDKYLGQVITVGKTGTLVRVGIRQPDDYPNNDSDGPRRPGTSGRAPVWSTSPHRTSRRPARAATPARFGAPRRPGSSVASARPGGLDPSASGSHQRAPRQARHGSRPVEAQTA